MEIGKIQYFVDMVGELLFRVEPHAAFSAVIFLRHDWMMQVKVFEVELRFKHGNLVHLRGTGGWDRSPCRRITGDLRREAKQMRDTV